MDLEKLIREYYEECKVMQLATVRDGKPWICTVYFTVDEDLNIYWTSAKKRQHSQEIMDDPNVAIAIVRDDKKKQALQITGKACLVLLDDVERVNKLYGDKFGDKPERLAEVLENTPEGRAYWMCKPDEIAIWDEVNFTPPDAKEVFKVN
jgi:uncharacterized pyridoxamine 5'-phosphate oxidase family protein